MIPANAIVVVTHRKIQFRCSTDRNICICALSGCFFGYWSAFPNCLIFSNFHSILSIKNGQVFIARFRIIGNPGVQSVLCKQFTIICAFFIHCQYFFVGNKFHGKLVTCWEVPTKNQRRSGNTPQCHKRVLFVGSKGCVTVVAPFGTNGQMTKRKHIAIRPGTFTYIRRPSSENIEVFFQRRPAVPEIVDYAPHVGMLRDMLCISYRGFTGRSTQHNFTTGTVNGFAD